MDRLVLFGNVALQVVVVRLTNVNSVPARLLRLLGREDYILVGSDALSDVSKLRSIGISFPGHSLVRPLELADSTRRLYDDYDFRMLSGRIWFASLGYRPPFRTGMDLTAYILCGESAKTSTKLIDPLPSTSIKLVVLISLQIAFRVSYSAALSSVRLTLFRSKVQSLSCCFLSFQVCGCWSFDTLLISKVEGVQPPRADPRYLRGACSTVLWQHATLQTGRANELMIAPGARKPRCKANAE